MYDVIILGGGPGGLTAGIYSGRANLKTLLIEPNILGGQMASTTGVENYPGASQEDTGMSLAEKMADQARNFNVEVKYETAESLDLEGPVKKVKTDQAEYESKTVILAMGAQSRRLGVPGEEEFTGRGVSYCATCDGAFYQGGDIYVIGGGNSAVEEGLFLTHLAKKVYIVHRRDALRADKYLQDRALNNEKVEILWNTVPEEIKGDKTLESMVLRDTQTGELREVKKAEGQPMGIFFYVGQDPRTDLVEGLLDLNRGYIVTDEDMATSQPGVFAVGDIRDKKLRQIATAVGDGAIAANAALSYIDHL
ncbi:MAG: thioredoxin-disulfide reductase [Tissierellia bacterium]|nr:thioredoxin-disulfide reductase [Tissierellia bacterium]